MALAHERLAKLVDWVKQSSASYPTPLRHDTVDVGPFAVFIPWSLNLAPVPNLVGPGHLPLWIPESQAIAGLPPPPVTESPASQPRLSDRLSHLVWTFGDRRFEGALIPLTNPAESLQTALDRHVPGLDLNLHPALFLPLWPLDADTRAWVDAQLPLVRG